MNEDDPRVGEIQDALETTDQLHNDVSRLKRLGIITPAEDRESKEHIAEVAETLTDKLPEE
jgi:hypothetical protein